MITKLEKMTRKNESIDRVVNKIFVIEQKIDKIILIRNNVGFLSSLLVMFLSFFGFIESQKINNETTPIIYLTFFLIIGVFIFALLFILLANAKHKRELFRLNQLKAKNKKRMDSNKVNMDNLPELTEELSIQKKRTSRSQLPKAPEPININLNVNVKQKNEIFTFD